jgi:hypothetical protein
MALKLPTDRSRTSRGAQRAISFSTAFQKHLMRARERALTFASWIPTHARASGQAAASRFAHSSTSVSSCEYPPTARSRWTTSCQRETSFSECSCSESIRIVGTPLRTLNCPEVSSGRSITVKSEQGTAGNPCPRRSLAGVVMTLFSRAGLPAFRRSAEIHEAPDIA